MSAAVAAQSPLSAHQATKSRHRQPLQPKNPHATSTTATNAKPAAQFPQISLLDLSTNKENMNPVYSSPPAKCGSFQIESLDSSLAEELSAIREKMERLKIEKEKTDKELGDRGALLDAHLKEIVDRGHAQKQLEIEVDRLYRLKEIKLSCLTVSPLRSLRDKEREKMSKEQPQKTSADPSIDSEI